MDLLKISTAGSVDDGKSTLIGRLLYETNSLKSDQIEAIKKSSEKLGFDYVDWSLATDGLVAEREQGITIDVANIYFTTEKRRFIIADTPGHVEYTRNMVTGTSQSDIALILIDARKGVIEQTYRHYFITNLLKVKNIVVCINKMDLMDYSKDAFLDIVKQFKDLQAKSGNATQEITFIPVSALFGENLIEKSEALSWYNGLPLLEHLENVTVNAAVSQKSRLPIQYVLRPQKLEYQDYRGYAGKVASGTFSEGDAITVLPSYTESKIKRIERYSKPITTAGSKENVTIILEDDVDISRGNLIAKKGEEPLSLKEVTASVCWMQTRPLNGMGRYTIQHGVNQVLAKMTGIHNKIDPSNYEKEEGVTSLKLNEIGTVSFKLANPIFVDKYEDNAANGSFIIIDNDNNNTVGVGFVR